MNMLASSSFSRWSRRVATSLMRRDFWTLTALIFTSCATSTALAGTMSLTWSLPTQNTDNTPANLTSTRVYWGCVTPGQYLSAQSLGVVAAYDIQGLPDSGTCYASVAAVNLSGEGSKSDEVSKFMGQVSGLPDDPIFPPTVTANSATVSIAGDNTQGPSSFPSTGDRSVVTCYPAAVVGTIQGGGAWFAANSGAGMNAKEVVYANGGANPSTRIAVSAAAPVPSGGGYVPFVISGPFSGPVCIGVVTDSYQGSVSTENAAESIWMATNLSYANPQASWPGTAVTYPSVRVDAWIEY